MKKNIFCYFLKKNAIGLKNPPYPGEIGKKIYKKISKIAWKKWIIQQTKIINEKKLNMLNYNDRKILEKNMINFLFSKQEHN
ncbi:MAG: oxidative damage protection protein [Buchnera aphidicola (Nurudea yanoniella)]